MGRKGATPKTSFQTPKRAGNGEEDFVTTKEPTAHPQLQQQGPSIPLQQQQQPSLQPVNTVSLERLERDVSLRDFMTWRTQWNDFCHIQRLDEHPIQERVSALRVPFSKMMLQLVEMTLGFAENDATTPENIVDAILQYIRKRRSVEVDRVEFNECRQIQDEEFEEFYHRLKEIARGADFCQNCYDDRSSIYPGLPARNWESYRSTTQNWHPDQQSSTRCDQNSHPRQGLIHPAIRLYSGEKMKLTSLNSNSRRNSATFSIQLAYCRRRRAPQ